MTTPSSDAFTVGLVQMRSGRDPARNVDDATALIREARGQGADFILTPETTHLMELERGPLFARIAPPEEDIGVATFGALAEELGVWLLIGSLAVKVDGDRAANRSFLFGPDGRIKATYDKIHMFDVDLPGGETYRESANFRPGTRAVTADLPWGRLGLTICYDLRFPHLYRRLAKAGAQFLTVPAAFTRVTGMAHWHVLLRARAIETGCFVFAPAQGGRHENGRETYGHSLVISPWGEILAEGGTEPGVITARIEPAAVAAARARIPALTHDREVE